MLSKQLNYLLEHQFDYFEDAAYGDAGIDKAFLSEFRNITLRMSNIWDSLEPGRRRALCKNLV